MSLKPKQLSKEYLEYLLSDKWRRYRRRCFEHHGNKCKDCGAKEGDVILQAHHLTYERLGNELLKDCIPLCMPCHDERELKK